METATTQQQFEQLISGILSAENQIRIAAEQSYEHIPLDQKGTLLFQVYLNNAANVEVLMKFFATLTFFLN